MAKTKIAINGFGRIGRLTFRQLIKSNDLDVVAINDLTDTKTLAHLLQYDSAQGGFMVGKIKAGKDFIQVGTKKIKVIAERDPAKLP
jgi:glyceraldehyde 3-phosphate dehydrogenase